MRQLRFARLSGAILFLCGILSPGHGAFATFAIPNGKQEKITVPTTFKDDNLSFICWPQGSYVASRSFLSDGSYKFQIQNQVNGVKVSTGTVIKRPWQIYTNIALEVLYPDRSRKMEILFQDFKEQEPLTTGRTYRVIGLFRYDHVLKTEIFHSEFWFEKETLMIPGYGKLNGIMAYAWQVGDSSYYTRYFYSPQHKEIVYSSSAEDGFVKDCVLR